MVSGIWYSSVTDSRLEALTQYVKSIILDDKVMLLSLNGDASFRRYFRVLNKISLQLMLLLRLKK